MRAVLLSLVASGTLMLACPAQASVTLAQRLPTADYYGSWTDVSEGQNFLTQIVLGSDATLGSMTIYTLASLVNVGDSTTLKIQLDASGSPSETNLLTMVAPISAIGRRVTLTS